LHYVLLFFFFICFDKKRKPEHIFFFVSHFLHLFVLNKKKIKQANIFLFFLDMDNEYRRLLYKNSSITLFETYIAIEKYIIDTRLSFIDQYKLFDLLKKLLPNENNQLTCQGFLSWLVWRVDQHEEHEQERQTSTNKRSFNDTIIPENEIVNKKLRISKKNRPGPKMTGPALV